MNRDDALFELIVAERERRAAMAASKEECEQDIVFFMRTFWRCLEPEVEFSQGWPLEAMADVLMAVADGHLKRVLINIFPGAAKSLMLNVMFPAWIWGPKRQPHARFISTSYSSSLTERDNGRLLRVMRDPVYRRMWPGAEIVKDGVGLLETGSTGWKLATSVGGKMTGFRADYILIDDANNPNDVESDTVRAATNLWAREVMPDRLNSLAKGAIVSIQQRVHEEDITGTLAKYGTGYSWLCIPMEYDPLRATPVVLRRDADGNPTDVWTDPRGEDEDGNELDGLYIDERNKVKVRLGSPMAQAEGALAWPDRFPLAAVEEQRKIKGAYGYSTQYQQLPTTRGGAIIRRDWWQIWDGDRFPDMGTIFASLDTALEEHTQADFNALTCWGAFPAPTGEPQLILTEAWKKRCRLAELVKDVADTCYARKVDYLLIERKTRGLDVAHEIERLYADAPWQIVLIIPQGDKVSRLEAVSGLFSGDLSRDPVTRIDVYTGGMVWQPDTAWADEVVDEVTIFPRGAHDDYVDTVSQALGWVRKNGVVLRKVEYDAMETEKMRFKRRPGVPYAITRDR